jgi:WD40 repeat protein/serine/threonine protein kinase
MANEPPTQIPALPAVPDYELIRCVGSGAFGEVWLARAKPTQRFRAIKIVHRNRFPRASLYETEFNGLRKFEELSREHAGFIDILHVSRNDQAGCFSYVMELADDLESGQVFDPRKYVSKTLASELERRQGHHPDGRGCFTPAECVQLALSITAALSALHQYGLVHRDIKPSNIVFVRGMAKLADVGLVTDLKEQPDQSTLIGSPPFMDSEVHGTAQGDLFGFGKVLYVMATGRPAEDWPNLEGSLEATEDADTFRELYEITQKACHPDRSRRYRSAQEIHDELLLLRVGKSARRLQRLERLVTGLKRFGLLALIIAILGGLLLYQVAEQRKQAAELRQHKVGSYVAYGTRALDENDLLGALPWFAAALREDADNPRTGPVHRLRLGTLLQQCPTIVQMWFTDHPRKFAEFAGQENQVLVPTAKGRWAIHDLATGQPLYPPFGTAGAGGSISLSPASHLAAVGGEEGTNGSVRVWNFVTGQEVATLSSGSTLGEAAISSDGTLVAAVAGTNVIVWRLGKRDPIQILAGHSDRVLSLAFSPHGDRVATASADATARVWDLQSGRELTCFTNHTAWVYCVSFSPDGRLVASSSFDYSVRVWQADTGREVLPPLWHGDGVFSVEFSPDGARLVTAGLDFSVRIWDTATGKLLQQLRHNSKPVYAGFSPSGQDVVTACYDGTVRVWALRSRPPEPQPSLYVFSEDGSCCAVQTNQAIRILTWPDGQQAGSVQLSNLQVLRVLLNRDASRLLTLAEPDPAGPTNLVQAILWDCRNGRRIGSPKLLERSDPVRSLSPSGRLALANTDQGQIVWDFESDREVLRLPQRARQQAFDSAETRLAVAVSNDVQVWDLATGQPLLRSPWSHDTTVDSVQWSPNGRYVLTACWDSSFNPEYAQVWDTVSGARAGPALTHRDGVRFAAFSPDGKKVITCSEDFSAMLWEWSTGRQLTPPLQHNDQVVYAAFTPDGRWVATACRDNTARVWDAETGEPITPQLQHPTEVTWVQWVGGSRGLLTRTTDGRTRLWNLLPDSRPLEKLVRISELLSAEQIHPTESAIPETKEALQRLWSQLRADYPADFSLQR